jgi:tripartite-type tricarboxylate transporter receptor subunit TctC
MTAIRTSRRELLHAGATMALAGASVAFLAPSAHAAETWPSQPVTFVVPAPPGGNFDIAARLVGKELSTILGQPFIIENRPGAGGKIAAEYVKAAARDNVLLFSGNFLLFTPLLLSGPSYDWRRDFVPVGSVSFTPMVLVVNPKVAAKNIKELLALARKDQNLTMAAPGIGTTNHLVSEMMQRRTGVKWTTAQYRGNAPATTDLIAGVVQFQFDQISSSLPHIQSGALRPIAVTSPQRVPSLPDVPTLQEEGYAGLEAETFSGVFAPSATAPDIVIKLNAALRQVVDEKSTVERLAAYGSRAGSMTPEAFRAYLDKLDETWVPVIKGANITGG